MAYRDKHRTPFVYITGLRFRQLYRRGPFPLKDPVHENPILPVAHHVEVRMVEEHLQMPPGYEARMSHVYVHITTRTIPPYGDAVLPHHVLEFAALQPRYGFPLVLGAPLDLRGARRGRLQGQQGPGVTLRGPGIGGHGATL